MSANEAQALAKIQERAPVAVGRRGMEFTSIEELYRYAQYVAASPFAPKDFRSPEAIIVAIQYGYELGLTPMQALQNIAVVNGRPSIYGDAMLAVVRGSGLLEWITEKIEGQGDERRAVCSVKRVGQPEPRVEAFGVAEARQAGLWGKPGVWQQYPERMLKFRARSFALRDEFGDVLKGLIAAEEAQDYPTEKNVTPIRPVEPEPQRGGYPPKARKAELIDRLKANAPEVAAAMEPYLPTSAEGEIPYGAPAAIETEPEPEAVDAVEEAVARDDRRERLPEADVADLLALIAEKRPGAEEETVSKILNKYVVSGLADLTRAELEEAAGTLRRARPKK